jgi:protein-S-isoprenylcysteine O-methyltransferase Ste14
VRNFAAGIVAVLVGLALIFSPLVMGERFTLNKYFVAFGIVALCLGLSFLLHGGIDALRRRGGGQQ